MINFHKEDTKYQVKGILLTKQVLSQLVEKEGFVLIELNLILCSDAYILTLIEPIYNTIILQISSLSIMQTRSCLSKEIFLSA